MPELTMQDFQDAGDGFYVRTLRTNEDDDALDLFELVRADGYSFGPVERQSLEEAKAAALEANVPNTGYALSDVVRSAPGEPLPGEPVVGRDVVENVEADAETSNIEDETYSPEVDAPAVPETTEPEARVLSA